jgi:uncharacterized protein YndB with AHSA1/START domain
LQTLSETRYAKQGVIPIDNTLIDHEGQLIDDVGWFWYHADQRHRIAHDHLIANYVCPSGKHYPLEFRRFRKRADCEAWQQELAQRPGGLAAATPEEQALATFKDHTQLCIELIDWVSAHQIPGDFTFDSYFTSVAILNHLQAQQRTYVGDLKFNRRVLYRGRELKASELAASIPPKSRQRIEMGEQTQWYFTVTLRLPEVEHPVRLVILWAKQEDAEPVKMLITNRTYWEVTRIVRVYRRRWAGTETFHRDGKQHVGMGDCQLRSGVGQTRHQYLVMLAYSLLMAALRQSRASDWAYGLLTTIGEACRAVKRDTLGKTIQWAIVRATQDSWQPERIIAHLALN